MTEIKINDDGTIEKVKKSDFVNEIKHSKFYALMPEQREFLIRDIKNNEKLVFNQKHLIILYLTTFAGMRRGEVEQTRKAWLSKKKLLL